MRFGLVGTGHWAQVAHGAGLKSSPNPEVELTAVWGRDPAKAAQIAEQLGVEVAESTDDLFEMVDAVAFAVPPQVQVELAGAAALAGCHLLLDKPVALEVESARALRDQAASAGVASVVFFTSRFDPAVDQWLSDCSQSQWEGGWARWLATAMSSDTSPYRGSTWRQEKGALWDIGPHALASLLPALGDVEEVEAAVAGARDLVNLTLRHQGGATSTVTLTLQAPPQASDFQVALWGEKGVEQLPRSTAPASELLGLAAGQLVEAARSGQAHSCDLAFGTRVVEVLAEAERLAFSRA